MRYFYLAPENELSTIFTRGINADEKGEIKIIVLKEGFLMDKFIFDVYAHEVLGLETYCLFQVLYNGIGGILSDSDEEHIFSDCFKKLRQDVIDIEFIAPYRSKTSYEGMGYEEGVFPVESKEKFTPDYKQKIRDYLSALAD